MASGNPDQFAPAVVALAKANPDKGLQIGKAIGGAVDEDQAAAAAGAIAGGVKNAQFSAALFQALAEYYPAARADIAAAVIAADPSSEAAVAAALEEVNTAAGAGLLSNPGPGAAPVNVNNTISDLQEAFIKTAGTTRLGNVEGARFCSPVRTGRRRRRRTERHYAAAQTSRRWNSPNCRVTWGINQSWPSRVTARAALST